MWETNTSKSTFIFISPHLDDVVLSCGGYIKRLVMKGEKVIVVTAITADQPLGTPISWLAHRNHQAWNLGDQPFIVRQREDIDALGVLGAEAAHLGLLDAIYRCDPSGESYYTKNTVGVPIIPSDRDHFMPLVEEKLKHFGQCVVTGQPFIFCPLGAGEHVDHLIVRQAVEHIFDHQSIFYYEDYPYAGRSNMKSLLNLTYPQEDINPYKSSQIQLTPVEIDARIQSAACYASQISGLFPSNVERIVEIGRARLPYGNDWIKMTNNPRSTRIRMSSAIKKYIEYVGGERYWSNSDTNILPYTDLGPGNN